MNIITKIFVTIIAIAYVLISADWMYSKGAVNVYDWVYNGFLALGFLWFVVISAQGRGAIFVVLAFLILMLHLPGLLIGNPETIESFIAQVVRYGPLYGIAIGIHVIYRIYLHLRGEEYVFPY